ncbi:MAG: inositol-3-phosphate synthase [Desulfobacterales bacterium]|nr:inositol-3-phosphate synthase [Desulfobacterales bacterium]
MSDTTTATTAPLLLLVPGIKGAIGSTLCLAARIQRRHPELILPYLTATDLLPDDTDFPRIEIAGWDLSAAGLAETVSAHGIVPAQLSEPLAAELDAIPAAAAPDPAAGLEAQISAVRGDIDRFRRLYPDARPVMINLLPACPQCRAEAGEDLAALDCRRFPDLAYALAAVRAGIPLVNFTPNDLILPEVVEAAVENGVPLAGRDGKTGQTYFKVVLASAFRARRLYVDGWYSMNILGNADGRNLMDPERAQGKLENKTRLLDDILGYAVGENYGEPAHKVHIDYYPPRGDAKEAWDVIDLKGLFGLPMSLRVNLQGRDSILAAPMAIDLALWMTQLQANGHKGPIAELGFFFKKPEGADPPYAFVDQVLALQQLAATCRA